MSASVRDVPGERPRLSRRRRRLYWTIGLLGLVAAAGMGFGFSLLRADRSTTYTPGEDSEAVTRRLALGVPDEAPRPALTDVTVAANLAGFRSFAGNRTSQLPEDMGGGAAWGDVDGDGDPDLFLVASGGPLGSDIAARAPSRLYINRGDGTFVEDPTFPDTRIVGMGAAWGDHDGDGALDLVVTGHDSLLLFRNEGGRLVPDPAIPSRPGFWSGATWTDHDRDGDLDLYVCGYVRYVADASDRRRAAPMYGRAVPYTLNPASFEPENNLLFRNDGGRFVEVAESLGVANPEGRSLGAIWTDLDDDGWPDLYVANDISDNALYLNRQGRFEDTSHQAWVADYRGAMGLAVGDWDRDGDDDLFITHWIAQENALYDSLLANLEPRQVRFVDIADRVGLGQIALQQVGWGTEFFDFDADGWLDLVVANGSTLEDGAQPPGLRPQPAFLFWSRRGKAFHDLAPLNPALATPRVGRGLAVADFDLDGDLDLTIVDRDGGVRLLRNDVPQGHWITVRLRGAERAGRRLPVAGTRLLVEAAGTTHRRTVNSVSYLSQSSPVVHVGLGEATRVDRLTVLWPDGATDVFDGLPADRMWEIEAGMSPVDRTSTAARTAGTRGARTGASTGDAPGEATDGVRTGDVTGDGTGGSMAGVRTGATAGGAAGAGSGRIGGSGRVDGKTGDDAGGGTAGAGSSGERERVVAFWAAQRAAMTAMRVENDPVKAIGLFRQALDLDPGHEDSLYYLANCLADTGDLAGALDALTELIRHNPLSHRAYKRWGTLAAIHAESPSDLVHAAEALERAVAINGEETGALQALAEVALLSGDTEGARRRLEWVLATNPRAENALFLLAYLEWKAADASAARDLLDQAQRARLERRPKTVASEEGDVRGKMHRDVTPLLDCVEAWNGTNDPDAAFAALDGRVPRFRS